MGRKSRTYYLFDNGGMLIKEFKEIKDLSNQIKSSIGTIISAVHRKSCLQLKYYVSLDKNFDINKVIKKSNFNPILSKQISSFKGGIINYFENIDEFLYED